MCLGMYDDPEVNDIAMNAQMKSFPDQYSTLFHPMQASGVNVQTTKAYNRSAREDDEMSVMSMRSSATRYVPEEEYTQLKPEHPDFKKALEAGTQNKKTWEKLTVHLRKAFKDRDDLHDNAILDQYRELEKNLTYSLNLVAFNSKSFIPRFANRICQKNVWVQTSAIVSPSTAHLGIPEFPLVPKKDNLGHTAFGSYTDYAQGFEIPRSTTLAGKLENTYVIEVRIGKVFNRLPYAVGVTLCHTSNGKELDFNDPSSYSVTMNTNYHFQIPPHYNSYGAKEEVIYKNSNDINDPYGREYSWLVPDEKVIKTGLKIYDEHYLAHIMHPVVRWTFEHANEYPQFVLPEKYVSDEKDKAFMYKIPQKQAHFAIKKLKQMLEQKLPIIDLKTARVKFEIAEKNPPSYPDRPLADDLLGNKSIGFQLSFTYLFRDFQGGVPVPQQQELQKLDEEDEENEDTEENEEELE